MKPDLTPKKIAVLFPAFLGDLLMFVPVLYAFKDFYPNSTLHLYTTKKNVELSQYLPCVDEAFLLEQIIQDGKTKYKEIFSLKKTLKKQAYDIAYFTNPEYFWPCFLAGVKDIVHHKENLMFMLFCKGFGGAELKNELKHVTKRDVMNVEALVGQIYPEEKYNFAFEFPEDKLKSEFIPDTPYIFFNIDGHSVKKFAPQMFLDLVAKLLESGETVVVDGLVDSFGIGERFKDYPNMVYTVGKTDLFQMFGLIKYSQMVISNDSGPSHAAASYKKKSLIFHPPKDNTPSVTGGFYKDNYAYKTHGYKSVCDLNCVRSPLCEFDYCKDDYDIDAIFSLYQRIKAAEPRSWEDKINESMKLSKNMMFYHKKPLTDGQKDRIKSLQDQGYSMTTGSSPQDILRHHIHNVYYDGFHMDLMLFRLKRFFRGGRSIFVQPYKELV